MGGKAGARGAFKSDKVRRFFDRLATEGAPWIEQRTMPLYALDRKNIQQALGTCVLLQIADAGFLLSASHVVRRRSTHTIIFHPWESNEAFTLNGMTNYVSADTKTLDTAFVRLPPEAFATLAKTKKFLRLSDLDLGTHAPPPGWYSIFGYPKSLFSVDLKSLEVTSKALYYINELRAAPLRDGVDGVTIAMNVATKHMDGDGSRSDLPGAKGASGCGMWRMHLKGDRADDWSISSIRLAGIQHGVGNNAAGLPRVFFGAMIHNVVAAIWQQYPDMRAPIDLHMPKLRSQFGPNVLRARR